MEYIRFQQTELETINIDSRSKIKSNYLFMFILAYFAVPLPPILILLIAIDPILTLARSAITGVLSLAITTVSTKS